MEINLNGNLVVSKAKTLMDLVLEQSLDPSSLIAEVNFKVVPQENWKTFPVRKGDTIELLSLVGGG